MQCFHSLQAPYTNKLSKMPREMYMIIKLCKVSPQLVLQVGYFPGLTLIGLHVVIQFSLSLLISRSYYRLIKKHIPRTNLSPVSFLSADFFLSLVQLPPHCLNSVVGLLILLLVLVSVTSLVLQLHHQLLDLLLELSVGLGSQHPLLGLGRELLLQVAHLGLQSG